MEQLLHILAIVFLGASLVLRFRARSHRTEFGQSVKAYNVKYWFMPWITVDYFTKQGHRIFSTSTALIMLGVASYLIVEMGMVTSL